MSEQTVRTPAPGASDAAERGAWWRRVQITNLGLVVVLEPVPQQRPLQ